MKNPHGSSTSTLMASIWNFCLFQLPRHQAYTWLFFFTLALRTFQVCWPAVRYFCILWKHREFWMLLHITLTYMRLRQFLVILLYNCFFLWRFHNSIRMYYFSYWQFLILTRNWIPPYSHCEDCNIWNLCKWGISVWEMDKS